MSVSVKKNMVYNMALQLFNIAFPFLTASYVSRTLGADKLGVVNYSQSIFAWAIIFANIGTVTYGVREIAKARNDKSNLSKTFSEIFIINSVASILTGVVFTLSILTLAILKQEMSLYLITAFSVICSPFNVDWFFSGIEDYKLLTLRNIIVKIVTFGLIVLLIKSPSDYILYGGLLIAGQVVANSLSLIYTRNTVTFTTKELNYRRHFKSLRIFFLSSLVIGVYTTLNGVILGFYTTPEKIAFFTRARSFQGMATSLAVAITGVLVPRIAYLYENDKEGYFSLLKKSLDYNYIISIPIVMGIIVLAKPLNIIFGGDTFIPAADSLIILAPLIFIIPLGSWGYFQMLLPMGKEKFGTWIQLIMALTSLGLTYLLVPNFQEIGASFALLGAETIGPIISFIILKRSVKFKLITDSLYKYILASIIMAAIIFMLGKVLDGAKLLILGSIVGALSYGMALLLLKEKLTLEIITMIKNKLVKN